MRSAAPLVFLLLALHQGCGDPAPSPGPNPGADVRTIRAEVGELRELQPLKREVWSGPSTASRSIFIGSLVTREHETEINYGPDGPTFTVKTRDGTIVVENLPLPRLAADYPEVYESFRGTCSGELWAGVRDESSYRLIDSK